MTVHRDVNETAVIVTHTFDNLDTARTFMQVFGSDESASMLQEIGVVQPVTIWLSEDV